MSIKIEIRGPSPRCRFPRMESFVYFSECRRDSTIALRVEILLLSGLLWQFEHKWKPFLRTTFARKSVVVCDTIFIYGTNSKRVPHKMCACTCESECTINLPPAAMTLLCKKNSRVYAFVTQYLMCDTNLKRVLHDAHAREWQYWQLNSHTAVTLWLWAKRPRECRRASESSWHNIYMCHKLEESLAHMCQELEESWHALWWHNIYMCHKLEESLAHMFHELEESWRALWWHNIYMCRELGESLAFKWVKRAHPAWAYCLHSGHRFRPFFTFGVETQTECTFSGYPGVRPGNENSLFKLELFIISNQKIPNSRFFWQRYSLESQILLSHSDFLFFSQCLRGRTPEDSLRKKKQRSFDLGLNDGLRCVLVRAAWQFLGIVWTLSQVEDHTVTPWLLRW